MLSYFRLNVDIPE